MMDGWFSKWEIKFLGKLKIMEEEEKNLLMKCGIGLYGQYK
jgi:hypothetical protein